jgi:hypothetical protein
LYTTPLDQRYAVIRNEKYQIFSLLSCAVARTAQQQQPNLEKLERKKKDEK